MSNFTLKIIALFTMLIDHITKSGLFSQSTLIEQFGLSLKASYYLINSLEWLGRITFPIFAYMIAEGCRKTKSISRYILRLFIFGIVSEIPYDLLLDPINIQYGIERFYHITAFRHLNIFFTLALGATAIACYQKFKNENKPILLTFLPPALCIIAGGLLEVDYSWFGVLLILTAYIPGTKGKRILAMSAVLALLYIGYASFWFQSFSKDNVIELFASFIGLLLLLLYNGKRGPKLKWLFYVFYPAHLIILIILRWVLMGK